MLCAHRQAGSAAHRACLSSSPPVSFPSSLSSLLSSCPALFSFFCCAELVTPSYILVLRFSLVYSGLYPFLDCICLPLFVPFSFLPCPSVSFYRHALKHTDFCTHTFSFLYQQTRRRPSSDVRGNPSLLPVLRIPSPGCAFLAEHSKPKAPTSVLFAL